jgi:hypothetical protein
MIIRLALVSLCSCEINLKKSLLCTPVNKKLYLFSLPKIWKPPQCTVNRVFANLYSTLSSNVQIGTHFTRRPLSTLWLNRMTYNILLYNLESAYEFYLKTDVCIKDLSGEFYDNLLSAVRMVRLMSGCTPLDVPCNALTHRLSIPNVSVGHFDTRTLNANYF